MDPPFGDDGTEEGSGLTARIRTGARRAFSPVAASSAVTEEIVQPLATRKHLPLRYQIKENDDGRFLTCAEASNIAVRVERGMSVSPSAARKYPRGTIFLDGVAQGEPFMDASRGIYNLDHHEGCVRAFTLATCEQAMVVILKGLDLDDERWAVWANEPDFDTVLAIWLLLNHRRLSDDDATLRRRMMPLVRLQGVIDAHGFELAELTAFPPHLQKSTLETINDLRDHELALKSEGEWASTDLLEFTRSALQQIDELVYSPGDFEGLHEVEELARVRISAHRLGVVCRSETGIYEVEEQLKEVHGERLGLVILQKDEHTYTLRQVDPFLPTDLDEVYQRLNLLDPAVEGDQRWGGSGDIGGSPRGVGTALEIDDIVEICRWVFQPPAAGRKWATLGAGVGGVAVAMAAVILAAGKHVSSPPGMLTGVDRPGFIGASLTLLALGIGLAFLGRARFSGYFGLRWPRKAGFLTVLPLTIGASFLGGGWFPFPELGNLDLAGIGVVLAGVIGIEFLLRGALHGLLLTVYPVRLNGGGLLSIPNLVAAVVYSAAVTVCFVLPPWFSRLPNTIVHWSAWICASLVMGLVLGVVRERWGSVWAAMALHGLSVVAVWVLLVLFGGF